MTLTFTLMWWHVPAAITLIGILMLMVPTGKSGWESMLEILFWLVVSLFAWIIAGALK